MKQIVLLITMLFMSACSGKAPLDPLTQAGSNHFGNSSTFVTFEVPAEEERPFILRRSTPAGRRLTEVFSKARRSVLKVIVGGSSSEATKKAILEAFTNHRGQLLGGLELVFVGDLVDAREVAKAAKPLLATVHFSSISSLMETES